jgi:hypothetical protein
MLWTQRVMTASISRTGLLRMSFRASSYHKMSNDHVARQVVMVGMGRCCMSYYFEEEQAEEGG